MNIDFKDLQLNIEYVDIDAVKPSARNPRTHNREQVQQIADSMRKFGWVNPILVDENMEIIAGHGRLMAGKQLGYRQVPVAKLCHLSEKEKLGLLVADNRITENAGWDDEKLQDILQQLHDEEFDLTVLGFTTKELEKYTAEFESEIEAAAIEDIVPESQDKYISKQGDIWILGEHKLLCGDACLPENFEKLMGDEKATMTFTDPPYNVAYSGSVADKNANRDRSIKNDNLGHEFYNFLLKAVTNILNYTKGSSYICMSCAELHTLREAFEAAGGRWEAYIVWVKNSFSLTRARYQHKNEWILFGELDPEEPPYKEIHEDVMVGRKDCPCEIPWFGGRSQTDVWNFDKPTNNYLHPTMKPVALIERAINNSSRVSDIVLDCFGGSGSTMIAAEKTHRRCRMIEIEEKYVDTTIRRWQEFTGRDAIHQATGKTFNELSQEQ
ncbi:MAG: site-specific DNA-methyltransferase [Alphaproteobacteria bacterium]|nr:site-specific DNA-methyltransferase [Alphaproteobacteria bacterium]